MGGVSGRSEAAPGANERKAAIAKEASALWEELEAELRRCPGSPAPSALWALVALPAAPNR